MPTPSSTGRSTREDFRNLFARLVVEESPEQRVLTARGDLRSQMISATEQVFGMMLGIEVLAVRRRPDADRGR